MTSLLAAAAALSPKLVSLHRFWLPLPPCLSSLSPFLISLLAAAAALSVKLVSLRDFALGCRCRLVCEACLPHDFAYGCRCRLVCEACLPS